jgi:hypothetical protein
MFLSCEAFPAESTITQAHSIDLQSKQLIDLESKQLIDLGSKQLNS